MSGSAAGYLPTKPLFDLHHLQLGMREKKVQQLLGRFTKKGPKEPVSPVTRKLSFSIVYETGSGSSKIKAKISDKKSTHTKYTLHHKYIYEIMSAVILAL